MLQNVSLTKEMTYSNYYCNKYFTIYYIRRIKSNDTNN